MGRAGLVGAGGGSPAGEDAVSGTRLGEKLN